MAYKIVNGKLIKITSQSDFGTPAQKAAGQKITGTLGNITKSPLAPKRTPDSQKITYGRGGVSTPSAPVVPQISAGGTARPLSAGPAFDAPPTASTPRPISSALQGLLQPAAPSVPPSRVAEGQFLGQQRAAGVTGIPTGTLGLGAPPATGTTFGQGPNQIVTQQDLRYRTLNNPVTLGGFMAVGATPTLQAQLDALMRGEEIDPVFKRFFLNQGIIEEDDFGITFPTDGLGTGIGTGGSRRTPTQTFGGRNPSAFNISIGLTNWRV